MLGEYIKQLSEGLQSFDVDMVNKAVRVIYQARADGRMVFTCGNGGSAATASHLAADLLRSCQVRTCCLNDSAAYLTGESNDDSYSYVFDKLLGRLVDPRDVLVAISCSGNSRNVLQAVDVAKENGAITVGLTAFDGGNLLRWVAVPIHVPVKDYEQAEDIHLAICHMLKREILLKDKEKKQ